MTFAVDCGEIFRCLDKDARSAALAALSARKQGDTRYHPLPAVVVVQDLDSGREERFLVSQEGLA